MGEVRQKTMRKFEYVIQPKTTKNGVFIDVDEEADVVEAEDEATAAELAVAAFVGFCGEERSTIVWVREEGDSVVGNLLTVHTSMRFRLKLLDLEVPITVSKTPWVSNHSEQTGIKKRAKQLNKKLAYIEEKRTALTQEIYNLRATCKHPNSKRELMLGGRTEISCPDCGY